MIRAILARWIGVAMTDPVPSLEERLRSAREEAEALAWYFSRHCPGGADGQATTAYGELVKALSATHANEDEDSYQKLMLAYHELARYTFAAHEVHGKSILDTTRKPRSFVAGWVDKRRLPVFLGFIFFLVAVGLQILEAWTDLILGPDGATADIKARSAESPEFLYAKLLDSCISLLAPAAWGALGACTALAKRVADRLSAMSFEENRMQALTARIFLGAALALVLDILFFVEGMSAVGESTNQGTPAEAGGTSLGFGPIAAALLAGLFVQHIYGALETLIRRVSRAISPEPPSSGSAPTSPVDPGRTPPPPAQSPVPSPAQTSPPSPGSTPAPPAGAGSPAASSGPASP